MLAVAVEARDDRVFGLAAETAFFGVLGIFPGLLLGTGLLGVLDLLVGADLAAAQQQVVEALDAVFTDQAAGVVTSVGDLFDRGGGGLLSVAALGALVTLSGAFAVVVEALNLAYGVRETRSWVRRRLLGLGLGLATVFAIVLAVSVVVVGPFLGTGRQIADLVGLGGRLRRRVGGAADPAARHRAGAVCDRAVPPDPAPAGPGGGSRSPVDCSPRRCGSRRARACTST